ncbi:hypothetical protein PWT90_06643 [Aphanocladium album]|nr:hypothetical protein PWT90_06643 [Aphanocladium album]
MPPLCQRRRVDDAQRLVAADFCIAQLRRPQRLVVVVVVVAGRCDRLAKEMAKRGRKKSSKRQSLKTLYPPTDIKQDTRSIPARTTVLGTADILLEIFSQLPQSSLILNVQGTCHLWRAIVCRMPETFLENVPNLNVQPNKSSWSTCIAGYPHLTAYAHESEEDSPSWHQQFHPETIFTPSRWFNPILFHHFPCIYGIPDATDARRREARLDLDSCYNSPDRAQLACMTPYHLPGVGEFRQAFKRPKASWRQMQLAAPPITKLRYTRPDGSRDDVYCPEGIRMGAFYDLVIDYGICEVSNPKYNILHITWAQEVPTQEHDSYHTSFAESSRQGDSMVNASIPIMGLDEVHVTRTIGMIPGRGRKWQTFADITRRRLVTDHLIAVEPIIRPCAKLLDKGQSGTRRRTMSIQ